MQFLNLCKQAVYNYFHPWEQWVKEPGGEAPRPPAQKVGSQVNIRIKFDVKSFAPVDPEQVERLVLKTLESMVGLQWGYGGEDCFDGEQEEREVILRIARVDVLNDDE